MHLLSKALVRLYNRRSIICGRNPMLCI